MVEIFVRPLREHLPALKGLLTEQPAEVFVSHTAFYGGGWLHEMGGPPNATLGDTCLAYPSKDAAPYGMGVAPRSGLLGARAQQDVRCHRSRNSARPCREGGQGGPKGSWPSCDSDSGPRVRTLSVPAPATLPPRFRVSKVGSSPLRPLHRGSSTTNSDQLRSTPLVAEALEAKRVVLVTQGTIANDPSELLAPSLEGLANRDVFVVATTGGADPSILGNPPCNAVVERFVPYATLMPHVDVMVSNGGFGSVQLAIADGVPMVVAGTSEDKKEVTAHVAWSGVGVNLRTSRPAPSTVGEAVERVLIDPMFKDKTLALRAQVGDNPAARAAELLERLAVELTTQSSLRSDDGRS